MPGDGAWGPVATASAAFAQVRAEAAGVLVDARDYYRAFYQAALSAEEEILICGWQVDSTVELVRGDDANLAEAAGGHTSLLKFLDHLCHARPALRICILAWDFHMVLALEREWLQTVLFQWMTHERLQFKFDDCHPPEGCHHQKAVVIDGRLAFVGGIDLCEARWDDRRHLAHHELRLSRGKPQKPYHDVQSFVTGDAAATLRELLQQRWRRAGGGELPPCRRSAPVDVAFEGAHVLPAGPVALSRTDPGPKDATQPPVREVLTLFVNAIRSARELIYIETQYFSSREIREALVARLRDAAAPKLDVVIVLNERAEALKEEIAVGLKQAENLGELERVAAETGHALGCYFTVASPPGDEQNDRDEDAKHERPARKGDAEEKRTYVHSKLMLVDDRFLTIGSANLTNRSMSLDTELHLSWDAATLPDAARMQRAIRRIRVSLLAEHAGVAPIRALWRRRGLVSVLDAMADDPDRRLRPHPSPTPGERDALRVVEPQALPFDPVLQDESERSLLRVNLAELWSRWFEASRPST